MSKRTRHEDNSKRAQPVQQQRAQAAQQVIGQKRTGQGGQPAAQERPADQKNR